MNVWTLLRTRWRVALAVLTAGALVSITLANYMADPAGEQRVNSLLGSPLAGIVGGLIALYAAWRGFVRGRRDGHERAKRRRETVNSLLQLSESDLGIVNRSLEAAVEGPFFPDWEFPILFGFDRDELAARLADWQSTRESAEGCELALAVLGAFKGYPHGLAGNLEARVGCSIDEVFRILELLRQGRRSGKGAPPVP